MHTLPPFLCGHESGAKQICGLQGLYHLAPAQWWSPVGYCSSSLRSRPNGFPVHSSLLWALAQADFSVWNVLLHWSLTKQSTCGSGLCLNFPSLSKFALVFTWKSDLPLCFLIAPLIVAFPCSSKNIFNLYDFLPDVYLCLWFVYHCASRGWHIIDAQPIFVNE